MLAEGMKIQGFSRLQIIDPDGKIAGDSGRTGPNQITNQGVQLFLAQALGSIAGSFYVGYAGLGEGSEPGAADTALESEVSGTGNNVIRDAVAAATSGSTGVRFTGTFASSNSFVTAQETIANIGLFNSESAGTVFAGNTFTGSTIDVNQAANYTYDITFTPS
jgi:hypothetical protein